MHCTYVCKVRTEARLHVLQIVTYTVRVKRMEYKGEQSFGRNMMQALKLLRLAKRHISEEIKDVAIAVIELRLSEGIIGSE